MTQHRFPCSTVTHPGISIPWICSESNGTSCHEVCPPPPMYSIPGHPYLMVETTFYLKTTQIILSVTIYSLPWLWSTGYILLTWICTYYKSCITVKWHSHFDARNKPKQIRRRSKEDYFEKHFSSVKGRAAYVRWYTFLTDPTTNSSTFQHFFIIKICYLSKLLTVAGKMYLLTKTSHLPCSVA